MISKLIAKIKKYSPPWSKYYFVAICADIMVNNIKIFKAQFSQLFI
jgi:hypothetical protein